MSSKRLTLSSRERTIIAAVIAYMTSNSSSLNSEGRCLLDMARSELLALRNRLLAK